MGIWNRRRKRELVGTRESGRRKGMRVGATSVCQRSVGMWEAGDAATLEAQSSRLKNPSKVVFAHTGCHGVAEGAALAAAGVKRISLATSLYRAAMTGLLNAAKEVREHGTFGYIDASLGTPDMNAFLRE